MTLMERRVRMNRKGATQGAGRRNGEGEGKGERMLAGKRPVKTCAHARKQFGNLFVRRCAFMSAFSTLTTTDMQWYNFYW